MAEKIYKRIVDVYEIGLKYTEDTEEKPTFEELLRDPILIDGDTRIKGKIVSFQILENENDYIIGLVETNRADNIPPLKRRKEKRIEAMDLPEGDGLAFGNVFYYDIKRNIILYEVNKNGSILPHFIDFIYKKLVHLRRTYAINSYPVLNKNQNERLQKMTTKTKISVEIAHPKKIAAEQVARFGTFGFLFDTGANLNSTTLKFEFSVRANHGDSLKERESIKVINQIKEQIALENAEIRHLEIHGYIDDGFDDRLQKIDLVTERLKGIIELREPRLAINLLEYQRRIQIKLLHEKLEGELISIFGE